MDSDGGHAADSGPSTPSGPLADLMLSIEGVLGLDPSTLDDEALHDAAVGLLKARSLLDAAACHLIGPWRDRRVYASDGSRSAAARLARDAGCARPTAGRLVHLATELAAMPATAAAHAAGALSSDHVSLLVHANAAHRRPLFARDEQVLVDNAARLDFDDFTKAVRYWRSAADDAAPQGDPEAEATHQHQRRFFNIDRSLDGSYDIRGYLDPLNGEAVATALARIEQELFEADCDQARADSGNDTTPCGPGALDHIRTRAQRRADALVEMCNRAHTTPADGFRPRPLISVIVGLHDLQGPIRETFNGTVLSPGQVASLLSEADIERAVFDPPSRVIDLGHRRRFFTGGLRRAIELRDRHCQHPGCTVPAEHCQVDHIVEYSAGGPTTQDNGRLLCSTHNRQRPGRRPTTEQPTLPHPPPSGPPPPGTATHPRAGPHRRPA